MDADGVRSWDEPDVVVVGASWRSASLADRERLAIPSDRLTEVVDRMRAGDGVLGAVVLSTCNRTEVYVHATEHGRAAQTLRTGLASWAEMSPATFESVAFEHHGERAVTHLLEVVSGFDSAIPHDRQIAGQVRRAVAAAREVGAVDRILGALFQHALASSRKLRTLSVPSRDGPDVLDLGLARARRTLGDLAGLDMIVVGAGEMGRLAIDRLHRLAPRSLTIANRGASRRDQLAARSGATPLDLMLLPGALTEADLVVLSTGAPDPILRPESVAAAMTGRTGRPLVLLDLAVPRNADRRCGDVEGVTVLDLDQLRRDARDEYPWSPAVETAVRRDTAAFTAHTRGLTVEPTIVALRMRAEELRRAALERASGDLADLDDRERAAVETLTRQLVAAILHEPTVGLKAAAACGDGARHTAVLDDLFDLPSRTPNGNGRPVRRPASTQVPPPAVRATEPRAIETDGPDAPRWGPTRDACDQAKANSGGSTMTTAAAQTANTGR